MKGCYVSCSIGMMFIIGMIYFTLALDKTELSKRFIDTLNKSQEETYKRISNERKNIYFSGYGLGFLLSIISLIVMYYNNIKITKLNSVCLTGAVTFITSYFYYLLSPKSDFMVLHLQSDAQKSTWLDMYKKMQYHYHLGLLLGLIGVMVFGGGFGMLMKC